MKISKFLKKYVIIKKNDVYRVAGFCIVMYGQTLPKDWTYSGSGLSGGLNMTILLGIICIFGIPFFTRFRAGN